MLTNYEASLQEILQVPIVFFLFFNLLGNSVSLLASSAAQASTTKPNKYYQNPLNLNKQLEENPEADHGLLELSFREEKDRSEQEHRRELKDRELLFNKIGLFSRWVAALGGFSIAVFQII